MANDQDALVRAVCEFPDEDTPRLALADWWREDGREDGREDRAEFVRLQFEFDALTGTEKTCPYTHEYLWPGPQPTPIPRWKTGACRCRGCRVSAKLHSLLADSLSLWAAYPGVPAVRTDHIDAKEWAAAGCPYRTLWERGFASAVACPAAEWLRAADHLAWPPQCVRCEGSGGRRLNGSVRDRFTCSTCGGTGRNPNPCPRTAHPIRRVAFSTEPRSTGQLNAFALWKKMERGEPWQSYRWPGVRFAMPGEDPLGLWGNL